MYGILQQDLITYYKQSNPILFYSVAVNTLESKFYALSLVTLDEVVNETTHFADCSDEGAIERIKEIACDVIGRQLDVALFDIKSKKEIDIYLYTLEKGKIQDFQNFWINRDSIPYRVFVDVGEKEDKLGEILDRTFIYKPSPSLLQKLFACFDPRLSLKT